MSMSTDSGRPLNKRLLVFTFVVYGLVMAALLSLGTWQVQRLAWKEGLLANIQARTSDTPASLTEIEMLYAKGEDIEYRPVVLHGTFDHTQESHFFATHKGESGFYLYTPLILTDGRTVIVNRGFVPYALKDQTTRPETLVGSAVEVIGLARNRLPEKPSFIVPENDPSKNLYYWKDWVVMVEQAGLDPSRTLPFFVDERAREGEPFYPVGGVTLVDLPNSHLQYALTWYGLAATLTIMLIFWLVASIRRTRLAS
ncbi:SURF1 family protein [Limoniibacter endophyticus]|uniref:SURF1-like protein n=1 Tax=Limoniibacter endophyticus TaxID=1565040 RepID=A0A8J3DIV3_9HYPH|nr:SURF1 family protein [Limoniibacter endophyticus]GHC71523.1 SURF1-like protein [Limoniibacter endophyticus]